MSMRRISVGFAVSMLLGGCLMHPFKSALENCHKPQTYQRASSVAPLKVPEGLDAPNVQGALVIPAVEMTAPPPGPNDPCLDEPPRYKPNQSSRPAAPGAPAPATAPAAPESAPAPPASAPAPPASAPAAPAGSI